MQVNFDLALVDADSIIYQVAHTNSSSLLACKAYDDYISNLIKHTEAPGAFVFIKGDNNFRQQYEQYKANRVPHIDPVVQKRVEDVYEHAREYCVESDDGEADDYVCFHANIAMQEGQSAIIVHIDKDLNCIPGWHYNFRKGTSYSVSLREAYEFQIMQLLQGDAGVLADPVERALQPRNTREIQRQRAVERRHVILQPLQQLGGLRGYRARDERHGQQEQQDGHDRDDACGEARPATETSCQAGGRGREHRAQQHGPQQWPPQGREDAPDQVQQPGDQQQYGDAREEQPLRDGRLVRQRDRRLAGFFVASFHRSIDRSRRSRDSLR